MDGTMGKRPEAQGRRQDTGQSAAAGDGRAPEDVYSFKIGKANAEAGKRLTALLEWEAESAKADFTIAGSRRERVGTK